MARYAKAGRVEWIGIRPERRAAMQLLSSVEITDAGLTGDRSRAGKRAVTLMQAEYMPVIGAVLGQGSVNPQDLRRNLVVSGINLSALKGRRVAVGSAVLEWTVICAPCSRMEETFGTGGYSAVRGHGGWCARVLEPGFISIGDVVKPIG